MASQEVQEFRDIVEKVISQPPNLYARSVPPWTCYPNSSVTKGIEIAGLTFERLHCVDGHLKLLGAPEFLWSITTEKLQIQNYVGRLSVVSSDKLDDTLERAWTFDGHLNDVRTTRTLASGELGLAVSWARAPHLNAGVLESLATFIKDEKEQVVREMAEDWEYAQALGRDFSNSFIFDEESLYLERH